MNHRTPTQFDRLHTGQIAVMDAIYAAIGHPERWQEVLDALTTLFDGGYGSILHRKTHSGDQRILAANFSPSAARQYEEYYGFINPLTLGTRYNRPLLQVNDDVVAAADLEASEFYNDFMVPLGIRHPINTYVPLGPGETIELAFCRHRKGGPFETGEADAILGLIPHFRRAVVLARRIEVAEAGCSALTLTTQRTGAGTFLVDSDRRVQFIDAMAERLAQSGDGLWVRNGVLHTTHGVDARLAEAIAAATGRGRAVSGRGGAVIRIPRKHKPTLSLAVGPVDERDRPAGFAGPLAIVLVSDPAHAAPPSLDALQTMFDLTPAEAHLASALCSGETIGSYSDATGTSLNTVKTHLKHVFEKNRRSASGRPRTQDHERHRAPGRHGAATVTVRSRGHVAPQGGVPSRRVLRK